MFGTFILGLAAGWAAPYGEPYAARAVQRLLPHDAAPGPRELTALALAAAFFLAAILAALLTHAPNAVALTLGGLAGVLVPRLRERFRAMRTPDYDG